MSSETLANYLRSRMREQELSNSDVAARANISRQTWYRLLNSEIEEAKISTLVNVADALDTHVIHLLRMHFNSSKFHATKSAQKKKVRYASGFVADVTYPHNSSVSTGETFTKTWRVINIGSTEWKGLFLQCGDGDSLNDANLSLFCLRPQYKKVAIPTTSVGGTADISVTLTAPTRPCSVLSEWGTVDESGAISTLSFGTLRCLVKVVSL